MSESEQQHAAHHEHPEHSHSSHSHGHRSHHHHRHHHHRRKKHRSPKIIFWERVKTDKTLQKSLLWSVIALILLAGFALLAKWDNRRSYLAEDRPSVRAPIMQSDDASLLLSVPFFDEEVYLVNQATLACAKANISVPVDQLLEPFFEDCYRLDTACPVELKFDVPDLPLGCSVAGISVELLEDGSATPRVFSPEKTARSLQIPLLKTDTAYTYRITITLSNGSKTAVEGSFHTAASPRILSIDGIANVRDIGGWNTTDGKTVRQGLLYRGTELDGAVDQRFSITADSALDMLSVLGIRTDMDLRSAGDNPHGSDALGMSVEHLYYNCPMYAAVFSNYGGKTLCKIFSDLADETKYPIYLHCTYGRDRTGTVCYLLEALLGLSEEDLMREYQLSALYYGAVPYSDMDAFVEQLKTFDGATMQEKAENYLLSIGVTATQIQQIRQIFLN